VHELAFGLKRAHLCVVAENKRRAKKYELTPARFDALMVVLRAGGQCLQREVWQKLGLARSTICKLFDALEDKGLVWRRRSDDDKRQVVVALTSGGLNRMVVAIDDLVLDDTVRARWDRLHADERDFVLLAIDVVRTITRGFYDESDHHYRTDDLDERDETKAYVFVAGVRDQVVRLEHLRDVGDLRGVRDLRDLRDQTAQPKPSERDPNEPPPSEVDLFDPDASIADLFWWTEPGEPWTDEEFTSTRDPYGFLACLERWAAGAAEALGAHHLASAAPAAPAAPAVPS